MDGDPVFSTRQPSRGFSRRRENPNPSLPVTGEDGFPPYPRVAMHRTQILKFSTASQWLTRTFALQKNDIEQGERILLEGERLYEPHGQPENSVVAIRRSVLRREHGVTLST